MIPIRIILFGIVCYALGYANKELILHSAVTSQKAEVPYIKAPHLEYEVGDVLMVERVTKDSVFLDNITGLPLSPQN